MKRVRVIDLETGRELPATVLPRPEAHARRPAARPRPAPRSPRPVDPGARAIQLLRLTPAQLRGPLIVGALLAAVFYFHHEGESDHVDQ